MSVFMICERPIGLVRGNRLDLDGSQRAMLEALNYEGLAASHAQDEALSCVRSFAGVRDELLQAYPWVFARKSATPATLSTTLPGWAYSYALPTDCIKLLAVIFKAAESESAERWEQVGRTVGCKYSPVNLRYTSRITDTEQWDPLFTSAFCAKLAAAAVASIAGEINMIAQMEQLAARGIGDAYRAGSIREAIQVSLEIFEWDSYVRK